MTRFLPALLRLAGFGLIVAGVAVIYWPAALVLSGGLLICAMMAFHVHHGTAPAPPTREGEQPHESP